MLRRLPVLQCGHLGRMVGFAASFTTGLIPNFHKAFWDYVQCKPSETRHG